MPKKKKIKVKVKKRKLKIKKILVTLLIIGIIVLSYPYLKRLPIKNIYIIGNNIIYMKNKSQCKGVLSL